jgi:hypothetical protein
LRLIVTFPIFICIPYIRESEPRFNFISNNQMGGRTVTAVIVCESCSFSMEQMSDFRSWVPSPFCLTRVLDLGDLFRG